MDLLCTKRDGVYGHQIHQTNLFRGLRISAHWDEASAMAEVGTGPRCLLGPEVGLI